MTFLEILPSLLLFEIVYKLLCSLIFRPILSGITQGVLTLSGHEMVFNGDIAGFFMNIPGILGTILLGMIAAFLAYFEYAVIILMIYYRYTDASDSLADSMKMALYCMHSDFCLCLDLVLLHRSIRTARFPILLQANCINPCPAVS